MPSCVDQNADSVRSPDEDPIAVVSNEDFIEPQQTSTHDDLYRAKMSAMVRALTLAIRNILVTRFYEFFLLPYTVCFIELAPLFFMDICANFIF